MNLLIFGASGATGHELVNQSLLKGHSVTAFVRDQSKIKVKNPKLKIVQGSITDQTDLTNAIKGHDVVLSALGASSPFKFDPILVEGAAKIVRTMEDLKVLRFIYLSFIGVGDSRVNGGFVIRYVAPRLLKNEIAGHEAREKVIRNSELTWTIIHAPTLTKGEMRGAYRKGENLSSNSFVVAVSRADVADFMLSQCDDLTFNHKTVRIMY